MGMWETTLLELHNPHDVRRSAPEKRAQTQVLEDVPQVDVEDAALWQQQEVQGTMKHTGNSQ
jgi:hypothetical protein